MLFWQALDEAVVLSWHQFIIDLPTLGTVVRFFALWGVYLIPCIWLVWWFWASKKERYLLFSSLLAGLFAWHVLNRLWKLVYFQDRPAHSLPIKELLFERPENSFPSDHAAFLAGIAFLFFIAKQRLSGTLTLLLALVVSACRIAVAVHYPSDIVIGFVDGLIAAIIVSKLHVWLSETVWDRLIGIAHRLKLA